MCASDPEEPIWFSAKSKEWGWLSNFSDHCIELNGRVWPTVEHYYQAAKFKRSEDREAVASAATPAKAKRKADRLIDGGAALVGEWEIKKLDVMRAALSAKFAQYPPLLTRLRNTKGTELLHQSNKDLFWGLNEEREGENHLGVLLAEIRGS